MRKATGHILGAKFDLMEENKWLMFMDVGCRQLCVRRIREDSLRLSKNQQEKADSMEREYHEQKPRDYRARTF